MKYVMQIVMKCEIYEKKNDFIPLFKFEIQKKSYHVLNVS